MGFSLGLGLGLGGAGVASAPSLLEQVSAIVLAAGGAMYDPSQLSTMTVGIDGTGGAPSVGSPVGRVYDYTGSGRYAAAPSNAARSTLRQDGSLYYLETDGVDDWMQISPTLNLGEQWWHVGGWRADGAAAMAAFATLGAYPGALYRASGSDWDWRLDADAGWSPIIVGDVSVTHVATVERASNSNISGRRNGGSGASINPTDDTAYSQGLALFSRANGSWQNGLAGRFYGGVWAPGTVSSTNRALAETLFAQLSGVTL